MEMGWRPFILELFNIHYVTFVEVVQFIFLSNIRQLNKCMNTKFQY